MVIAGKYALTHVLGCGGMGLVLAATHLQLERRVAIKFLLPQHLEKPDVVGRFTREARSAAKIQSDHVAHVLDVGIDDGTPYMVMEYLEGEDLKQLLSRRGPLPVDEVARYVGQACEALTEAHALGIVHRDLKPANLFLAKRPNGRALLKVLDFGISKIMNPATETELTLTSRAVGSPSYMAPEQLTASRSLDGRADIWALGVVLYELLTRRRPFHGESMPSLVALILKGKYERLDTLRSDLPETLVAAVHRCLEVEPENRFASITELADVLAAFAPTDSVSAVDGVPRAAAISRPSMAPAEDSNTGHGQTGIASVVTPVVKPARPRRRAMLLASGGFGMAVTAGVFYLVLHAPRGMPRVAAAPSIPATVVAPPPSVAPPSEPATSASPASDPAAPPASAPAAAAPASASPPTSAATHHPTTPTAPPRITRAPAPSASAAASAVAPTCHLVSYFDAMGDKHFRQECP
jgi:serine/threonine protein kinase